MNNQILPIDPSVFTIATGDGTIIDTGTTLAYLPDEAYVPFVQAVSLFSSSVQPLCYFTLQERRLINRSTCRFQVLFRSMGEPLHTRVTSALISHLGKVPLMCSIYI